jgi:type VII secretion protein EccE
VPGLAASQVATGGDLLSHPTLVGRGSTADAGGQRLIAGRDVRARRAREAPAGASTGASAKEIWRGLRDASGYLAAYRVAVDDRLPDTLAEVRALPSPETWTALEITGTAADPGIAVVCALRSDDRPSAKPPVAGLTLLGGRQRPALNALNPLSAGRLETKPVPLHPDLLNGLHWRASRTATAAV